MVGELDTQIGAGVSDEERADRVCRNIAQVCDDYGKHMVTPETTLLRLPDELQTKIMRLTFIREYKYWQEVIDGLASMRKMVDDYRQHLSDYDSSRNGSDAAPLDKLDPTVEP